MNKSIFKWLFLLITLYMTTACQNFPTNNEGDENSNPPWMTPKAQTESRNATRTPPVIPDRTAVPFKTVGHTFLGEGYINYSIETARFSDPKLFILKTPEDSALLEKGSTTSLIGKLNDVDFDTAIVFALYGDQSRIFTSDIEIRIVYLMGETLQTYAIADYSDASA